jgi:hypothetical protein
MLPRGPGPFIPEQVPVYLLDAPMESGNPECRPREALHKYRNICGNVLYDFNFERPPGQHQNSSR